MKELIYSIIPRTVFEVAGIVLFYGALFAFCCAAALAVIRIIICTQ